MFAMNYAAWTHTLCGDCGKAISILNEHLALAEQKDAPYWRGFGVSVKGCALMSIGDTSAAVNLLTSGMTALHSTGATLYEPWLLSNLANAYVRLAQFDDAKRCINEALTGIQTSKERWCEAEVHRTAGEIAFKSPLADAVKAEAYFEHALAVARQQQAKSWELCAAMSLARLWRDQGKPQQARQLLAPVYGWFTQGFDTRDLREAKALLDELAA